MNSKLRLFITSLVKGANLIAGARVVVRYAIIVLPLLLSQAGSAQYQETTPGANSEVWDGIATEPNYTSFPSRETMSPELWAKINPGRSYAAGAAHLKTFGSDSTKYAEVIEKRNAYESYYVNPAQPSLFSLVKGLYPINFKRNGEWIPIDAQLRPMGNNNYEAPDQWNPVGIHVKDHKTYIETKNGKVQFNDWTLFGVNGNDKTVLAKANWNNYTIGADGIRILNIFPGMDAEMRVSRGGVKTSFIIHEYKFAQYQELYFEDSFNGLRGKGLHFEDHVNDRNRAEAVYVDVADESAAFKIAPAFGYAKKNPSVVTNFPYHISGNKLAIAVPADYIIDNLASGDVIIDPLVQSSNSIAESLVGTMFNASCNYANSCDYTISVTPPPAATLTNISAGVSMVATAPCGRENFAFHISSGTCHAPSPTGIYTVPGSLTGPGTFAGGVPLSGFLPCMPAPSCAPTPADFIFKLYRGCVGPTGCDNTCIGLMSPLTVQIQGRTAELTAITASTTSSCFGQDITFSSSPTNGVAPFNAINWSYDASGTPSLGTGNSITTGAALAAGNYTIYANATDACGTVAKANLPFTVNPLPVATLGSAGTSICNGTTTNIAPTSTVLGTTYSWTVVQTGVTGASAGTGTSIAHTLTNTGASPGTAVYTITPTANGCPGTPITYTVTVNPVNNVLHVDAVNGNDANCGDTWTNALKTLSLALNLARQNNNVESILVAKGTYYPTGDQSGTNRDNSFVITRGNLKLYGGYPNGGGTRDIAVNPTVLSGDIGALNVNTDNSYHVMVIVAIPAAADSIVIDGFTLTKGNANGTVEVAYGTQPLYRGHGAGMYIRQNANGQKTALRNLTFSNGTAAILAGGLELVNASPYIQNCIFQNNRAGQYGGALANDHSASPYVTGCSFIGNISNYAGGAVFTQDISSPTFIDCSFTGNTAVYGGVMVNRDGANVTVTITKNIFTANNATGGGGAILNDGNATVNIDFSVFDRNTGGTGGAFQIYSGTINLTNDVLVDNSAGAAGADGGGAVLVYAGTVNCFNVTFSGNTTQSTTKPNANGFNIAAGGTLNLKNSIAWGNPAKQIEGIFNADHSLIKGTAPALPNLDLDPQFADAANPAGADGIWFTADDGLQLTPCSPAANMGSNALVPGAITTDMAGNARIFNTTVDMGAYELQALPTPISFTDVVKTYGDADAPVPNITNCSGLPLTFTIADNTVASMVGGNLHILKAGTTTITAHPVNGMPDVTVTLTVNPKPVTIGFTTTPVTKIYDGNNNAVISAVNLQFASGDVVGTDDVGIAVSSTAALYDTKDVGTGKTVTIPLANISLTGTTAANYTIANVAGISGAVGVITPLAVTVTADTKTKIYGDADPALTYTISPALAPADAFTGALNRMPGEDVGTYAINQGTLALSSNYTITYNSDNLTITPKAITVTAEAKTKVYGDTDPVLTYTHTPALVGTDAFTGSLVRTAGENVGTYPINQGSLALSSNYTITYNSDNLTITPKAITVTAEAKTKVYGDTDPVLTYTHTPALVGTDAFTGSLVRTTGENVGTYPINQGSLALSSNYTINYNSDNLTITPKAITVTADAKTKIYGDADPAFTYTYSPALTGGDVFTGSLARTAGENVGAYPINQGTLAISGNYTISFVSSSLNITPKAISVTAEAKTKVYGDTDPVLTYTHTPALVGTDAFIGLLSRNTGEDVGTYAINQGTLVLSSNYTLTYNSNNLNITPKAITVSAEAKTKIYGDADPVLTYTFTPALVGTDAFTGSLVRTAGENVGAYPINQGSLALSSNYTITYNSDNLTITPKAITVSAEAKTKIYGDADPVLTYTFTPALIGADVFSGSLVRTAGENVGTYPINQGSLALSSNYTITYNSDNLTITPKTITVTADAKTKIYGDADPAFTYTYSPALTGGDVFTGSLARTAGENVGAYPINQGTLAISGNYTISFVSSSLNITPKAISVTAEAKTKVYGDTDPVLTYTHAPALIGSDAFTGLLSRNTGEDVGIYAINQGTLALSSNYTITYNSDNLTITPKAITVTADAKTKVYGDTDPVLTYTHTPALVGTDAFTGALNRTPGEDVGIYAINQGTLVLSSNYTLTYNSNNLNITPKAITVSAEAKTKIYGDADPVLTYTFTPALIGADVFSGSLVRAPGENVGTYPINQGTLALNSNYTITYNSDNLTITPKAITVTTDAKTKIYGDADPVLTYTFTPALIGADVFSGSLVRTSGENVGTYPINQGTLALSSNYNLVYTANTLTITQKTITVTAEAKTKIYGDADPAFTYTYAPALVGTDLFSGALSRTPGENAGSYAINQHSLALSSNYQLVYMPASLVIDKAVLTVTAVNTTICLNGVLNPVPVTYAGFKNGDDATSLTKKPIVTIPRYNKAGNYTLAPSGGVAANYIFGYVNGQLTVLPIPEGAIAQSPIGPGSISTPGIANGVQLTAPAGTGYTYAWSTGERSASIVVKSNATYEVLVTNPQGCASRFATRVLQQTLVIPNIFSPNGDGIHDRWVIENLQNFPGNVVQLYNRYGQAVFKWTNFTSWDGKVNGKDMPVGTYYYIIDPKNGQKPFTGYIDIIR